MELLMEILLWDGGIQLLLGPSGMGEGELKKYMMDWRSRQQFLLEAAHRCQEAGLYDKDVEIHKRVGAFAMALQTINKCLSDAVSAMAWSMLDGESRAAALIHSGNEILETTRNSSEASIQEKDLISKQQTVLRQLEAHPLLQKQYASYLP
ncbi:Nuclear pore complex protein NUP93A [Zea mays]|uniref:Nuclear pore protein n=1 Tax=Zea mays TaxID=4577 RepID=A0A1D6P217_MAIZE|nr:Nuclear pore complex protein NUP93A [Zea mays]